MKPITVRQQQILEYIKSFIAKYGFSPSMQKILDVVDLHSTSCVRRELEHLERLGLIERLPNKASSIRVVEQGDSVEKQFEELKDELDSIGKVAAIGLEKNDSYQMKTALQAIQMAVDSYE
jgi:repressor LexA